jgi:hypothetical protein
VRDRQKGGDHYQGQQEDPVPPPVAKVIPAPQVLGAQEGEENADEEQGTAGQPQELNGR